MTGPESLRQLIRQIWNMPYGAPHIAAAEEAVRQADALGDPDLAFDARMAATPAYQHGGEPAKAFVTFSWCLAEYDRDPGRRDADDDGLLRWYFKYVVSSLTKFPEVPLDRTHAVLDDMQSRYLAGGHSLHAVYQYRWAVAHHVGNVAAATRWYERWYAAPRDENSDCAGCDPTSKVVHLSSCGRDADAIALGAQVLAGRVGCREQPQSILTALLLPYVRTGQLDEARDAHRRAYRAVRHNVANLGDVTEHIEFCGLTGNEVRGLEIIERHLDWLDRAPTPFAAMGFAAASAQVLGRLAADGHGAMTVQRRAFGDREAGDISVAALRAELTELATDLASRFDDRNGTTHQGQRIAGCLVAEPLVDYLPLSATAPRPRRPAAVESITPTPPMERPDPEADATAATAGGPDDLLDLIEAAILTGAEERGFALLTRFAERYDAEPLTVFQRGRRADAQGVMAANGLGDLDEAHAQWRLAVELYDKIGATERAQAARGRLGLTLCELGRVGEGLPLTVEAAAYLLESGAPHLRSSAAHRLAGALLAAGRPGDALNALDRAAEDAPHALNPYVPYAVDLSRAQCLGALGRLADSVEAARRARDGFSALGHAQGLAAAAWAMALGLEATGDLDGAVAAFDDAIAHLDDARALIDTRHHRAKLLAGTNRAAVVIDELLDLVAWAEETGDAIMAAQARFDLALAYRNCDRFLDAAEIAEEAIPALAAVERPDLADRCRYLLATVYRELGDPESALAQLNQLAINLDGFDNAAWRAGMQEEAAEVLYRMDRDAEAADRFLVAADTFRDAGQLVAEVRNRRMAALSLRWAGDPQASLARLAEADAVAESLSVEDPQAVWEKAMLGYDGARVLMGADELDRAADRIAPVATVFRSIDAYSEALQADLFQGELLLRSGRPADAEPVLRMTLAAAPVGSDPQRGAIWLLIEVLEALGRPGEAEALRREHNIEPDIT
jgi:tetratricopeptide (TPR) repeat protein